MSNFTFSYRSEEDEGAPSSMSMSFSAANAGEIEQAFRNFLNVCGYYLPTDEPEEPTYKVPSPSDWDWDDSEDPDPFEVRQDGKGGITPFANYCQEHPEEPGCRIYEL